MKIFNVKWTSKSAGPSPYENKRTEVFLAGCRIAMEGHPCKGCFNPDLWNPDHHVDDCSPEKAAANIIMHAPNKYITFVGGEPLDQLADLALTCEILKKAGYNICVITHYELKQLTSMMPNYYLSSLLDAIDLLIDGAYKEDERIWDEDKRGDGLHDVIGSGNQIVWDIRDSNRSVSIEHYDGIRAGDLTGLFMDNHGNLKYITKDEQVPVITALKPWRIPLAG